MTLLAVEITEFRCLERVALEFDARYNLIVGPNASGKTSLLEALFFLGRGRSFRSRKLERVIRQGQPAFMVVGRVERGPHRTVLGVRGTRSGTEIRIGGAPAESAGALAQHFSPQVIDPEIHKLLEEGPGRRRRFLDWGVFHVEQGFMAAWQRYHRALRQRNAALKVAGEARAVQAWDRELVESGEALAGLRRRYLDALAPALARIGRALLGMEVATSYQAGWATDSGLADALVASWDRDRRYGVTHVGPHRADVMVRVDGVPAKERVSRGQQKLLAAALTLAQLITQEERSGESGALLLDDPAAELDSANLERLLAVVRSTRAQLFVTALSGELPGLGTPGAMFHVERGSVQRLA